MEVAAADRKESESLNISSDFSNSKEAEERKCIDLGTKAGLLLLKVAVALDRNDPGQKSPTEGNPGQTHNTTPFKTVVLTSPAGVVVANRNDPEQKPPKEGNPGQAHKT